MTTPATDEQIATWQWNCPLTEFGTTWSDATVRSLIARIEEDRRERRETKSQHIATVNDLLRQLDAARKDQIEIREALGCTEDDDDYIGALRKLARSNLDLRAEIERLTRITGPVLPCCGETCTEHSREWVNGIGINNWWIYCSEGGQRPAPPEYLAWKAGREKR